MFKSTESLEKKLQKTFFPASKIQRKLKHSEEVQNDEFTFRSILQFFHGVLQPLQFWVERPENTVNKFLIEVRSGDAFSVKRLRDNIDLRID